MSNDLSPNSGNDLLRIHRVITRGLNVSLQHSQVDELAALHPQGFVTFLRSLTIVTHAHHAGEEEISFPFWQTRLPGGLFDELLEQHQRLLVFLQRIDDWREQHTSGWQPGALETLHGTLAGLQTLWQTHIAREESAIGPQNSSKYLTPDENVQLSRRLAEHGQAHSSPAELVMPFIVYNLDPADRAVYTRLLPPVMMQQLIPQVWKAAWEPMKPFLLPE